MGFLTPDKVRTEKIGSYSIVIKEKIIPDSARATKDIASWAMIGQPVKPCAPLNGSGKPKGITIHNTARFTPQSGTNCAEQSVRATWPNQNSGGSAVTFYVDNNEIWQELKETEQGWHAADGTSRRTDHRGGSTGGNLDTISIECIESKAGEPSEDTTAKLAAYLCVKYGLDPLKDIYTHNYWMYGTDKTILNTIQRKSDNAIMKYCVSACTAGSDGYIYEGGVKTKYDTNTYKIYWPRKNCPVYILPTWTTFLNKVNTYYKQATKTTTTSTTTTPTTTTTTIEKYYVGTVYGANKAQIEANVGYLGAVGFKVNMAKTYGFANANIPEDTAQYIGIVYGTDVATMASYLRGITTAVPGSFVTISQVYGSYANTILSFGDIPSKKKIVVGGKYKLKSDALVYGTSNKFSSFVYNSDIYVKSISGTRAVFSIVSATGATTGAVDIKYLV